VGTTAWLLEFAVEPRVVATVLLVPVPLLLIWSTRMSAGGSTVRRDEWPVLLLVIFLLAIGLGRATWSQGPVGELYSGTVSRTLEVSNRSDSRIQYHVVQLAAHGLTPYGRAATGLFAPFNFYARGPLAGLGAAPVVLSAGATPQTHLPDKPWEPFDAQGFATYRILLMLLGATSVLSVYGLIRRSLRPRAALAGAVLVAMSPFVVHEVYFTWPKLYAASFAIVALVACLERKPFVAGLLLGLAYLAHPSALIAVPVLLLVWASLLWRGAPGLCADGASFRMSRWPVTWARDAAWMTLGLLIIIYGSWHLANSGHTTDYFNSYLVSGYGRQPVAFGTWVNSRLDSVANTVVPFRLPFADGNNIGINAYGARSPGIIRFSFSYIGTLPFAAGLLYFPVFLYGLARFARRAAGLFVAAVVAPFVGFLIYWGANTSGLIREGLQFPFVIAMLAAFVGHSVVRPGRRWDRIVHIAATARAVEVAFMVMVPTIATMSLVGGRLFEVTDVLAILLMIGGVLGLAGLTWWAFGPGTDMAACAPGPGRRGSEALAASNRPIR
jgi:Dolichyl-phosphate-mannose-protein mannosyltransferase